MDLSKVLHRKECVRCGTFITGKHMKPPFLKVQIPKGYYGGRVKKTMKAVCDCGEEYIALLTPGGNSYTVVDLIKDGIQNAPSKDIPKIPSIIEPEDTTEIDFENMKRAELMKLAASVGVQGRYSTLKTADLINAITEAMQNAKSTREETGEAGEEEGT